MQRQVANGILFVAILLAFSGSMKETLYEGEIFDCVLRLVVIDTYLTHHLSALITVQSRGSIFNLLFVS